MVKNESTLMTVRDVAQYLNCSEKTIWRLKDRGELAFVRLGQNVRSVRFRKQDIDQFVEDHLKKMRSPGDSASCSAWLNIPRHMVGQYYEAAMLQEYEADQKRTG